MNLDHIRDRADYPSLLARFERSYTRGKPRECWEWQASYFIPPKRRPHVMRGWFAIDGQKQIAARVSYAVHWGAIGGLHVLHRCDNPACVNPRHLFLGTSADNSEDMARKLRSPVRRFNAEEVRAIRASPESARAIARKHGCSYSAIDQIRARKTWKWLE